MTRRRWTHRRLGIGSDRPSELAMAAEDRLLDEVGARGLRGLAMPPGGDALQVLLTDYVTAIDVQIAAVDRGAYRAGLPVVAGGHDNGWALGAAWRRSRRTLIPVAAGATVLAIVAGAATLPHALSHPSHATALPTTVVQPHLAAAAESRTLLHHAGVLLTAAHVATRASDRAVDVRLARADLTHVAALVPLAPRADRPALQRQVAALRRAAQPPPGAGRPAPHRPMPSGAAAGGGARSWPGGAAYGGRGPGGAMPWSGAAGGRGW